MSLFQTSVLKQQLNLQDKDKVNKAYKKYVKYFLNPTIQDNIRSSKEEEYQGIFLTELFVNVLDYTLKPKADFNLVAEYKNQTNSRKADGAILHNNIAVGVIELKGTNTKDLESIRKQAFDYKANQKGSIYVITSNFEKLRFYINDATEFEEFNLFELTREQFPLFYLCLQKDNLLNNIPLQTKEASVVEEEQITKQFYKDYSLFKRELYRDLVKRNSKRLKNTQNQTENSDSLTQEQQAELLRLEKNVKLTLFKKSQKLIDRFLFIFFAEDRGLLPANSTEQILDKWKADIDFGDERPLYNLFKQYFRFLDQGRQGTSSRAEIYAYNGGLFKEDTILDSLELDNDLLYTYTKKLAGYDFESQVDVNILGHIFENSLNEIESVNAEIEGGDFDKQKSKRKKDGVFYTPKYITKYIVENTIGKLCTEKKTALNLKEEEYFKGRKNRNKSTITNLVATLDNYRDWLLQLTICDPACGSGAFLNQALDFLIKEHSYIDELKTKVLGGGLQFSDIENTILENNIYGVDLNEESVEIAKLSLWLRTAQPRRKLNDLSSNIKCGNSLIDSKAVAGDKAFNWEEQFPQVFKKGGFDVIVGNPPYVRNELISQSDKKFLNKNYKTFTGKSDLYVFFFEKAYHLINKKGEVGFIVSSKYTKTKYGKILIDFLLNNTHISTFIDFKDLDVFEGIVAYPSIILFNKEYKTNISSNLLVVTNDNYSEIENQFINSTKVNQKDIFNKLGSWSSKGSNDELFELLKKINTNNLKLEDFGIKPQVGIKTGLNSVYIFNAKEIPEILVENELLSSYVVGREVKRYNNINEQNKILFPYETVDKKIKLIQNFDNNVWEYLSSFRDKLSSRAIIDKGIEKGNKSWYEYQQIKTDFDYQNEYIIYPDISSDVNFTLVKDSLMDMTCFGIPSNSKSLLGILNSKLIKTILEIVCVKARGGYLRLKNQYILNLPIPENFENSNISRTVETILNQNITLQEVSSKFQRTLQRKFEQLEKLPKKLENWYELSFAGFTKELKKKKIKLSLGEEAEWEDYFLAEQQKAQALQTQINQTDKEIDAMVYELYGLTEEEIAIVENS
ncbi:type II endonuclease-methyltransferasefusion protein [Patiriisocius marinus]|uniref:site-specific DNA-methyltransferase (adenine-specific) n=1 Tax=Patiriisocius marinus TaxID=1397112 RepID=A0A5J4IU16_9FLAO|nr:DNA methyltransferase [Patiriisocius marinus]GER58134.1 type II endonuclease-methyltransferasefusion protein [Patiriisocius marinus]